MLHKTFIVIPMDDRPCTYNFPAQLGEIYGAKMIMPPKELLGNLKQIADKKKLSKWLLNRAPEADGIIISIDTLGHGGLIPSRRHTETFEEVARDLMVIKELKKIYPQIPIYACTSIMRISNSNDNQEEKQYWSEYGELIYNYSHLLDKFYLVPEEDYDLYKDEKILNPGSHEPDIIDLRSKIPADILKDFIAGRFRNFRINKLVLKWVKEGLLDFLIICADDSSQYGFNVIEKRILNHILEKLPSLKNKIIIYPGADEAISILFSRMINKKENFIPKFYSRYSKSSKSGYIITKYEGIALKETIERHVSAVGGILVNTPDSADAVLYFHTSEEDQEDQYLNAIYGNETRKVSEEIIENDINNIKKELVKNVALIDVAYANGGDHAFMSKLSQKIDLKHLLTYSAWNTAGNSIGTALAHSNIRLLTKDKKVKKQDEAHYNYLFERFLDDWLYQGFERLKFVQTNKLPLSATDLEKLKSVAEHVGRKFLSMHKNSKVNQQDILEEVEIENVSFPWNRVFEIEIQCKVKIKSAVPH